MCDLLEIFGEILTDDAAAQLLDFVVDCVSSIVDAVSSSNDRRNPPGGTP